MSYKILNLLVLFVSVSTSTLHSSYLRSLFDSAEPVCECLERKADNHKKFVSDLNMDLALLEGPTMNEKIFRRGSADMVDFKSFVDGRNLKTVADGQAKETKIVRTWNLFDAKLVSREVVSKSKVDSIRYESSDKAIWMSKNLEEAKKNFFEGYSEKFNFRRLVETLDGSCIAYREEISRKKSACYLYNVKMGQRRKICTLDKSISLVLKFSADGKCLCLYDTDHFDLIGYNLEQIIPETISELDLETLRTVFEEKGPFLEKELPFVLKDMGFSPSEAKRFLALRNKQK